MISTLNADPLNMDRFGTSVASHLLLNPTNFSPVDIREIMLAIIKSPRVRSHKLETQPVTSSGTHTIPGGLPLLHLACATANFEVVQTLVLDGRMSPDTQSSSGATPLSTTITAYCANPSSEFLNIIDFLINQGCNPAVTDSRGTSPLGKAIDSGFMDLVMTMLRRARYVMPIGVLSHSWQRLSATCIVYSTCVDCSLFPCMGCIMMCQLHSTDVQISVPC